MSKKIVGAAAAVAGLMISASAFAASVQPSWINAASKGEFDVTGVVPAVCAVQVDDLDTILDLWEGETAAKVAVIKETCNSGSGYTVKFSSANGGDMVHESDPALRVGYAFSYDSVKSKSLASDISLTRSGLAFQQQHTVTVDVTGDYERTAGTYQDFVTVTIAAN